MDTGVQSPNLPRTTTSDSLLVNAGGGTARQLVVDLAKQLIASEPMRVATYTATLYETVADLPAISAQVSPWVYADPDPNKRGIYAVSGAVWVWALPLPYGVIKAEAAVGGTANELHLASGLPVLDGMTVTIPISITNTGNVTVILNGEAALPLKTNSGLEIEAGGLPVGGRVVAVREGSEFRLTSDVAVATLLLAAKAAAQQDRIDAQDARTIAVAAAGAAGEAQAAVEGVLADVLTAAEATGDIKFTDTKAAADALVASLPANKVVEVTIDETQGGARTRYRKESGALAFKRVVGVGPDDLLLPAPATGVPAPTIRKLLTRDILVQHGSGGMSARLQAAIDEMALRGGGEVYVDADGAPEYILDEPLIAKAGVMIRRADRDWALDLPPKGQILFKLASGVNAPMLQIAPDATTFAVIGVRFDANGAAQSAGCGIHLVPGASDGRAQPRLEYVEVTNAYSHGIKAGTSIDDGDATDERVYSPYLIRVSVHGNGGHGIFARHGDARMFRCFGWKNAGSGLFEAHLSGAMRSQFCDFWDNGEYGVQTQGQNGEWVGLQADLNARGGVRINKNANGSIPQRHSFIAGNTTQNNESAYVGGGDFHISDGAFGLIWSGYKMGYIVGVDGNPRYAICDDSTSPAANIIVGCHIQANGGKYTVGPFNDGVIDNYVIIGCTSLGSALQPHTGRANNLLRNASFRRWSDGAIKPDAWGFVGTGESANLIDTGRGNGVEIVCSATDETQGLQQVCKEPYASYQSEPVMLVADCKPVGTNTIKKVQLRAGANLLSEGIVTNNGEWQLVSIPYKLGASVAGKLAVRLVAKTAGDGAATGDKLIVRRVYLVTGRSVGAVSDHPKDSSIGIQPLPNSATPDVSGWENWYANDATEVTSFSGTYEEGDIVSIVGNGSKRFTHGTLKNKGSANVTPPNGELIEYKFTRGFFRQR